jgi:GNAT superfamily N-acetyltransferase
LAGDADKQSAPAGPVGGGDPGRSPDFAVHGPLRGQGAVAEGILRALPGWFGIETSIAEYAAAADELPTFVAVAQAHGGADAAARAARTPEGETDGTSRDVIGFVTVRPTSEDALELHVMGVLVGWHRRGVGGALVERAAAYARAEGFALLHVKTLAASDPDPGYAATRAFYLSEGFLPLEVIREVWGPDDPCLVLVRPL